MRPIELKQTIKINTFEADNFEEYLYSKLDLNANLRRIDLNGTTTFTFRPTQRELNMLEYDMSKLKTEAI